jgi:hypothetical protein
MTDNALKSVSEVAAELEKPQRTVYNWIREHKLTAHKENGRTVVDVNEARALLARRTAATEPASAFSPVAAGRQQANGTTSGPRTSRELAAKGFRALQDGARPEDLVTDLGMLPDEATALVDAFEKLHAAASKPGTKLDERLQSIEQALELLRQDLAMATDNSTLLNRVIAIEQRLDGFINWAESLPVPVDGEFVCPSCRTAQPAAAHVRCMGCGGNTTWRAQRKAQ